jgi:hypothetical protein
MRYYEFTKPNDYTALIANEINDVIRQPEQVWRNVARDVPKKEAKAKMVLTGER